MNALLLYPKMPDTFIYMKLLHKMLGKKSDYPPLGLITIAAMLPEKWNLKVIDLNVKSLKNKDLDWSNIIFISAMNVQAESVQDLVEQCSTTGKPIVAGGPLFVHEHERFPKVDHFVLNEAEITLPKFLDDLGKGKPQRYYKSTEFASLEKTPVPRYDLIDLSDYAYGILQYSRGCPFECDFCDVTQLYGHKPRIKTPEQIIQELTAMGDLNKLDMILFSDDNLIGNKSKLKKELLPELIQWRAKYKPTTAFTSQVSLNIASDEDLMNLMLEAGFRHLLIGIETPEAETLKESLKIQNVKIDLLKSIEILHQKGYVVHGGFIVGFDSDQANIFDRQAEFIQKSGIFVPTINILKAPKGTVLAKRMESEGRLFKNADFYDQTINFMPKMPIEQLYQGYLKLTSQVLLAEGIFERMKNFFKDYKGAQVQNKLNRPFRSGDLITFLRIFWTLGLLSKNRLVFWKFTYWGFRNYPRYNEFVFLFIVFAEHCYRQHRKFVDYINSDQHKELVTRINS